ncbi:hypothetical protein OG599_19815 [Streptomyces sp. NBC_01335]|uniref:hypothetical protein n=1 Tax=Streptomyces sp. NBC_01335 TaxID=2903828 RepID=UPI002E163E22|nr:hypothetical protein OG599_19815 [Streptomyces sp. NBC_01335]
MRTTMSWSAIRRGAGALAATAALAATSGCTVPIDAVAGISMSRDGHLLGAIMVCGHHIDGATLYTHTETVSGDSDDSGGSRTVGSWTADTPLEAGLTTWSLDSPSPGWTATTPLEPLAAGTTYILYGWTEDNSWSAAGASFTVADRDRLAPGSVLRASVTKPGETISFTSPLAEFKANACDRNEADGREGGVWARGRAGTGGESR